jgi:hypothetical protein
MQSNFNKTSQPENTTIVITGGQEQQPSYQQQPVYQQEPGYQQQPVYGQPQQVVYPSNQPMYRQPQGDTLIIDILYKIYVRNTGTIYIYLSILIFYE